MALGVGKAVASSVASSLAGLEFEEAEETAAVAKAAYHPDTAAAIKPQLSIKLPVSSVEIVAEEAGEAALYSAPSAGAAQAEEQEVPMPLDAKCSFYSPRQQSRKSWGGTL